MTTLSLPPANLSHFTSANCNDPAKQNSVWYNYLRNIRPFLPSDNVGKGGLCFLSDLLGHCGWSLNPQINECLRISLAT